MNDQVELMATAVSSTLESFEEGVQKMNCKVKTLASGITEHIKLVSRALRHQGEFAVEQKQLIQRSISQELETKASFAEVVRGACEQLVKEVSSKGSNVCDMQSTRRTKGNL